MQQRDVSCKLVAALNVLEWNDCLDNPKFGWSRVRTGQQYTVSAARYASRVAGVKCEVEPEHTSSSRRNFMRGPVKLMEGRGVDFPVTTKRKTKIGHLVGKAGTKWTSKFFVADTTIRKVLR
jgi:hypothetical protein